MPTHTPACQYLLDTCTHTLYYRHLLDMSYGTLQMACRSSIFYLLDMSYAYPVPHGMSVYILSTWHVICIPCTTRHVGLYFIYLTCHMAYTFHLLDMSYGLHIPCTTLQMACRSSTWHAYTYLVLHSHSQSQQLRSSKICAAALDRFKKLHSYTISASRWTRDSLTDASTLLLLAISTTDFISALVITSSSLTYSQKVCNQNRRTLFKLCPT